MYTLIYNIPLKFMYFIYSSLHLLMPYPHHGPLHFPLLTDSQLFVPYISESMSAYYIYLFYFLDSTYKW